MEPKSIFEPFKNYYCPEEDEPSCFGPDIQNFKDNPWVVWKRNDPTFDEKEEGSPGELRKALKQKLESERWVMAEFYRIEQPPLLTPDGQNLSLGWVIWHKLHLHHPFEKIHERGMELMQQRLLRERK